MITDFFLDLIFPKKCVCGKWDTLLCDSCKAKINYKSSQTCPLCRKLSANGKTCPACRHKTALTGVMIFGSHETVLKKLIWNYKYELIKALSVPLSEMLVMKFGSELKRKKPVVTFVPLSKNRMNWRGFNQSELLAKEVSSKLELELQPLLKRVGKGKTQVGLRRRERIKNLKGRIEPLAGIAADNKKVVIVDDVYTSGATLEECARVLRKKGFREIYGLVISRD